MISPDSQSVITEHQNRPACLRKRCCFPCYAGDVVERWVLLMCISRSPDGADAWASQKTARECRKRREQPSRVANTSATAKQHRMCSYRLDVILY